MRISLCRTLCNYVTVPTLERIGSFHETLIIFDFMVIIIPFPVKPVDMSSIITLKTNKSKYVHYYRSPLNFFQKVPYLRATPCNSQQIIQGDQNYNFDRGQTPVRKLQHPNISIFSANYLFYTYLKIISNRIESIYFSSNNYD